MLGRVTDHSHFPPAVPDHYTLLTSRVSLTSHWWSHHQRQRPNRFSSNMFSPRSYIKLFIRLHWKRNWFISFKCLIIWLALVRVLGNGSTGWLASPSDVAVTSPVTSWLSQGWRAWPQYNKFGCSWMRREIHEGCCLKPIIYEIWMYYEETIHVTLFLALFFIVRISWWRMTVVTRGLTRCPAGGVKALYHL